MEISLEKRWYNTTFKGIGIRIIIYFFFSWYDENVLKMNNVELNKIRAVNVLFNLLNVFLAKCFQNSIRVIQSQNYFEFRFYKINMVRALSRVWLLKISVNVIAIISFGDVIYISTSFWMFCVFKATPLWKWYYGELWLFDRDN